MNERYILSDGKIVDDLNSDFFSYEDIEGQDILSIIAQGVNTAINHRAEQIYKRQRSEGKLRLQKEIKQELREKYKRPLSQLKKLMSATNDMRKSAKRESELNDLIFLMKEAKLDQEADIKKIIEKVDNQNSDNYFKAMKTAENAVNGYKTGKSTLPTRTGIAKKSSKKEELIFYRVVNGKTENMTLDKKDLEQVYTLQKSEITKEFLSSPYKTESRRTLDEYMEINGYDKTDEEARKKAEAELYLAKIPNDEELQNIRTIKEALANLRTGALTIESYSYDSSELVQFVKNIITQENKIRDYEDVVKTLSENAIENAILIKKQTKFLSKLSEYQQKGIITEKDREKMSITIRNSVEKLNKQQSQGKQKMDVLREGDIKRYLDNVSKYEKFNGIYTLMENVKIAREESENIEKGMQFVKNTIGEEIAYFQIKNKDGKIEAMKEESIQGRRK
jgi:hypothetical protein